MRTARWKDALAGAVLFGAVSAGALAVYWEELSAPPREVVLSPAMSIRELAKRNGIPPKEIVHLLSHEEHGAWTWPRRAPVSELPVETAAVRRALEHAMGEERPLPDVLRFALWGAYLSACLGLLAHGRATARIRRIALFGAVAVFGVALGSTPNPMEATVKTFKAFRGMEASVLARAGILGLFSVMAVVGNKLICGWGCQLGALQGLLHGLSPFKGIKRRQVPFWLANGVRVALFLVFLDLLFGGIFGLENFVVYHHVNFFKLYRWELAALALALLPVLGSLSLLVYRPFCQFVCPFGLFSWFLENTSLYRVRIDEDLCISCGKCVRACPTEAMKARMHYDRRVFLPDCWACGACVEACPVEAVVFDRSLPSPKVLGKGKGSETSLVGAEAS